MTGGRARIGAHGADATSGAATASTPLDGLRILIPRGGAWGEGVADEIAARGGRSRIVPLLRIEEPENRAPLAAAVAEWNRGAFDWLVVTSANAVRALATAGAERSGRVAALGPGTALALREAGFDVALVPDDDFSGAGLARALRAALVEAGRPSRVLLPVSEIAGDTIERALRHDGHEVRRVTAYRTLQAPPDAESAALVAAGGFDAILVTSGSAAAAIAEHLTPLPPATRLAAIGPPAAAALTSAGLRAHLVARTHTIPGLLDALAARGGDESASGARAPAEPSGTSDPSAPSESIAS